VGVVFDIAIEAEGIGVDATTDQLNALAEKITFTSTVATKFDAAVAAVRSRLEESTSVTKAAAAALSTAEARYRELENAANRAAKQVEKAALAGKDTTALQTAAAAATEKMREQAIAVDQLRLKSDAAANAQTKLAKSLKVLEGEAASAASAVKKTAPSFDGASTAVDGLGKKSQVEDLKKLGSSLTTVAGGATLAAFAIVALAGAAVVGVGALAKFAVTSNKGAMDKLTASSEAMKKSFAALFTGIKLDKFIAALEDIMSFFDEGTSSANGLKVLFETMLQPLFDAAAKAGPFMKEMFKGMLIVVLQVTLWVLQLRNAIFKAMSPETRATIASVSAQILTLENAMIVGKVAAYALVVVLGLLGLALISCAISIVIMTLPLILIGVAIYAVVAAIDWLIDSFDKIGETLDGWVTSAKTAVTDLIDGIVNGIKSGAGKVVDAMKNMASNALKGFTDFFQMNSPSKLMQVQGTYITAGAVEGIEEGSPEVESALESMASPDSFASPAGATAGGTAPAGGSRGGNTITIQQLTIGDSPVASQTWADFKTMLAEALDGATITIGGGEAPAT
jgi:hypothetical protein